MIILQWLVVIIGVIYWIYLYAKIIFNISDYKHNKEVSEKYKKIYKNKK